MLPELLLDLFFSSRTSYAQAKLDKDTVSYFPVEGTPTKELIAKHLKGSIVLGSYTLRTDSTVDHICWDVDSTDLVRARNLTEAISDELGDIPHGIEFSGNKGYHIWIFLAEPVSAKNARAYGIRLREAIGAPVSGDPHVEVFPKQDLLTPNSPLGNLLKLPLGIHPKTGKRSIFVDRENGWEAGQPLDLESLLKRGKVDFQTLEEKLVGATPVQKITNMLSGYWTAGERHNLSLAISGFLASLGWIHDDVVELITNLVERNGGDLENLLECVDTTFSRLVEGKTIQGFSALNERLPVSVMKSLSELAGQMIADPSMQIIDRIRLEKGTPTFMRIRSAANTIFATLSDSGKFVQTESDIYWLDLGSHTLLNIAETKWYSILHNKFGINPKESFGVQVHEDIRLKAFDKAGVVKVYKRFHWDGSTLHINFGGPEVYKLSGDPRARAVTYNGAEDFLFLSSDNGLQTDLGGGNLLTADPLDPWKVLTNDLSFDATTDLQADSEQQRQLLRAWILQMFFGNILSTRPIALLMGPRGSGKTTTARRILRFFEGCEEDVLGIVEDKPDSLRASLEEHIVLVLDNMEKTRAKWLDNMLNRLATGAQMEIRKLYHSNEKYTIRPDCFVLATGIELPTAEEALYSRILPINLSPLASPRSEYLMQSALKDNMISMWRGMFDHLDRVITQLRTVGAISVPNSSRLADFVTFCYRIRDCGAVDSQQLMEGLSGLSVRQNKVMGTASPAVQALDIWLNNCTKSRVILSEDQDPTVWRNAGGIFRILSDVAKKEKVEGFRWSTPAAFARHWSVLVKGGLAVHYEVAPIYSAANGRTEDQYRFPLLNLKDED